jgi:hypothetical protein
MVGRIEFHPGTVQIMVSVLRPCQSGASQSTLLPEALCFRRLARSRSYHTQSRDGPPSLPNLQPVMNTALFTEKFTSSPASCIGTSITAIDQTNSRGRVHFAIIQSYPDARLLDLEAHFDCPQAAQARARSPRSSHPLCPPSLMSSKERA